MPDDPTGPRPRIALIHAVRDAIDPIHDAFAREWPGAAVHDLLDSSLSIDRAAGCDAAAMTDRFVAFSRYAATTQGVQGRTAGILFTCSAFGPQIEAAQRAVSIPVVKPNEGAFVEALQRGNSIGLLVTFEPALAPLVAELRALATQRGHTIAVAARRVDSAFAALQAGDIGTHDRLVAAAAREMRDVDVIVLGQFSMARAITRVAEGVSVPVIATPDAAVRELRARAASVAAHP